MSISSNGRRLGVPALVVGMAVSILTTCGNPVDRPGSTLPGKCEAEAPTLLPLTTDILFVIDNSNSMAEEQAAVATELPAFLETLDEGAGVAQDYRVGVITTSVYLRADTNGDGVVAPTDAGVDIDRSYGNGLAQAGRLQDIPLPDGGATTDYFLAQNDPDLLEKFRRVIRVGTTGSGQETPFEAVRLALSTPLVDTPVTEGGLSGFLRDGARLLVVVVTDEDDCSENTLQGAPTAFVGQDRTRDYCREKQAELTPVQEYFDIFRNLKDGTGATRELVWAAIAPVGVTAKEVGPVITGGELHNVDCPTSFQPGYRHKEMATLFDSDLRNLDSVCRSNFSETLVRIAEIANTPTSASVMNAPDPRLLVVEIERADGTVERCTTENGGIRYEPSGENRAARVYFQGTCARRPDDQQIRVKLICVG